MFQIIFLADIEVKNLPIYCKLEKTVQKHLEKGNIVELELCNKL